MSNVIISVENLGKCYQINHRQSGPNEGLRHLLNHWATAPLRALQAKGRKSEADSSPPSENEDFWALRDVSFEIKQGEVVGIIGRNGAGKSTLLKILSRITEPTQGRVRIKGRVASLLEVGTGFHPELTGRENVYLNGAILGMSRAEIKKKFDEIVAFADVEKFLDTPVKRYSSGMYVRLAFAVAAHLEPEILIVDEVLAVGDAAFQKKCLGKMQEVSKGGKTVVFVSHQMNSVSAFCERGVLLEHGRVICDDRVGLVIDRYLGDHDKGAARWDYNQELYLREPAFTPLKMELVDTNMNPLNGAVEAGCKIGVLIEGKIEQVNSLLTVGFAMYTARGELLWWSLQTDTECSEWPTLQRGLNRLLCWIPPHLLNEGSYRCELMASLHHIKWISQPLVNAPSLRFDIRGGLSDSPYWVQPRPGLIAPILKFYNI
jgi:lipopolysaccharide transport system ATP-binding protein